MTSSIVPHIILAAKTPLAVPPAESSSPHSSELPVRGVAQIRYESIRPNISVTILNRIGIERARDQLSSFLSIYLSVYN